jgi:hypothetical protein
VWCSNDRATGFRDGVNVGGGEEFAGVQVFASMDKEEQSSGTWPIT